MKIYLLHYDTDTGSSEEWNHNYTPTEVFLSKEGRDARIKELTDNPVMNGEEVDGLEFMEVDLIAKP